MIIGIDPGLKGAICFMDHESVTLIDMPLIGKEVDVRAVRRWISSTQPGTKVFLEALGVRPRQAGVQCMIRNWQRLEDAVVFAEASLTIVQPKQWQKGIVPASAQGDRKKVIAAYCNYARKKYPLVELIPPKCRVIQDGRAAALLIAEYGRTQP